MESTTENNSKITSTTSTVEVATKDATLHSKEIERNSSPFDYKEVVDFDPLSNNKANECNMFLTFI